MINFDFKKTTVYTIGKTLLTIKKKANSFIKPRDFNVTMEQCEVLHLIWEHKGLTQREIAEDLCKDKGNITRTLDLMQRHDLIKRQRDESDRRAYKIFLTEKGKRLIEKLLPPMREINKKIIKGISKRELEEFTRILNIIQGNLEK
jgi:DNA-binding MarR family transcriptional regulator